MDHLKVRTEDRAQDYKGLRVMVRVRVRVRPRTVPRITKDHDSGGRFDSRTDLLRRRQEAIVC
jgi:hypothetical protein